MALRKRWWGGWYDSRKHVNYSFCRITFFWFWFFVIHFFFGGFDSIIFDKALLVALQRLGIQSQLYRTDLPEIPRINSTIPSLRKPFRYFGLGLSKAPSWTGQRCASVSSERLCGLDDVHSRSFRSCERSFSSRVAPLP